MSSILIIFVVLFTSFNIWAGDLQVELAAKDGKPLQEAIIALYPVDKKKGNKTSTKEHQVNQQAEAFVPKVLAVQVGDSVKFVNRDNFNHQVYSFSKAKSFKLGLHSSSDPVPPPEVMPKEGLVVVGCNIHDNMVGYIYVLGTSLFKKSSGNPTVFSNLPPGDYEVRVFHYGRKNPNQSVDRKISIQSEEKRQVLAIKLNVKSSLESDSEVDKLF